MRGEAWEGAMGMKPGQQSLARVMSCRVAATALLALALTLAATQTLSAIEPGPGGRQEQPEPDGTVEGVDFWTEEDLKDAEDIIRSARRYTRFEDYDRLVKICENLARRRAEEEEFSRKKAEEAAKKGEEHVRQSASWQVYWANMRRNSWLYFAAQLKSKHPEWYQPAAQPQPSVDPGRGPVWTPPPWFPGERLRHMFFGLGAVGGNVNVPSFGAGTQFDAVLGRERQIIFSPRNLTFAGGAAEFRAPVSSVFGADVPSTFSQVAFYAKLEGYSFWGSESGSVPFGGNNVAYTYLFPNPATGTTGVLAGASGQDISIKANGEAIRLRAGAEWQVSLADMRTAYAIISGGLAFDYTDSGYEITQQSLFFSDVSSRTKLRIDDYFFAPYIGAGVRFDDGNVFASVSGFVAPGLLYTDASAKQRNLCGPCPNAGDRDFKLRNSFSNTRFAVQTGIDLKIGARLTPSIAIEGGFQYVHTSHSAFLRPPTTPSEQPVRLDYGSANRFGGQIGIKYTF
jgi:hypothetical protein